MAHETYKTEGFVLGGVATGEAHRYISLYTKELGLVRGVARSVREERSKLRYALQDFSYGRFSLVRGKEVWRVVGAEAEWNLYHACALDRERVRIAASAFVLLRRLLQGEGENRILWDALLSGAAFLREYTDDASTLDIFEHVFVLQILYALGYVRRPSRFEELLDAPLFTADRLAAFSPLRSTLALHINRALEESQL